jgi:hypothetical protein
MGGGGGAEEVQRVARVLVVDVDPGGRCGWRGGGGGRGERAGQVVKNVLDN